MQTIPIGDKVVRYSPNWNSNIGDDLSTPTWEPSDMEVGSTDTTSLIYTPPFTLYPPELIDDFIINWDFHVRGQAVALSDTHSMDFWIRVLDTHYGYPVDTTGGTAPIANSKHLDLLKVSVTLPTPTSVGCASIAEYGFRLRLSLLIHNQAEWSITDNGASDNGYTRMTDPDSLAYSICGSMQRGYAEYRFLTGRHQRGLISVNNTVVSNLANEQIITHSFTSGRSGGVNQNLYPRDGGAGVNLWLMGQKTSSNGAFALSSGLIYATPRILRPGMVAGQTAVHLIDADNEVIS